MKLISVSQEESEIHQLKIGRTVLLDELNSCALVPHIIANNLDVCRVKVRMSYENFFSDLASLNLPYSFYSILIRQRINLSNPPEKLSHELNFKLYNSSDEAVLEQLLKTVLSDDTAMYYRDELSQFLIQEDKVLESILKYTLGFDHQKAPNKFAFLAYENKKAIGFCTLEITNGEGEGIFVGILPEHRSQHYFKAFIHSELMQSYLSECSHYNCNTVIFNPRSLNGTLSMGMKIADVYANLNVFPCLSMEDCVQFVLLSTPSLVLTNLSKKVSELHKTANHLNLATFQSNIDLMQDESLSWKIKFIQTPNTIYAIFYEAKFSYHGYVKFDVDLKLN